MTSNASTRFKHRSSSTTILRIADYGVLAKTFSIDDKGQLKKNDCSRAKWFMAEQKPVANIHELSECLQDLEGNPQASIIRGETTLGTDLSRPIRRKASSDPNDEYSPYIQSSVEGVPWLCVDIDNLSMPTGHKRRLRNWELVKYAVSLLPECFRDVTCHWQFSASFKVTDHKNLRLHLWFWLDRPVTDSEARRWAKHISADYTPIDESLYQAVQLHYTAAPIFEDGIEDPVNQRSGLLEGNSDEVIVPDIPPPQPFTISGGSSHLSGGESFEYWMDCIGDHEGGRGFHEPLRQAAWFYVRENGSGIDRSSLVAILREAVLSADQSSHTPEIILSRASEEYLFSLVDTALAKMRYREPVGLLTGVTPRYSL